VDLARVAGQHDARTLLYDQEIERFCETLRRIATGRRVRADVRDDERAVARDPQRREGRRRAPPRHVRDCDRQNVAHRLSARRRDEIELAADLVPNALLRLGIGHPVTQQVVGVLAAMREATWDPGEIDEIRSRQRVLAVDVEDDSAVVTARRKPIDQRAIVGYVRGRRLHPRRFELDDLVERRHEPRGMRARRRRQQRQMPAGTAPSAHSAPASSSARRPRCRAARRAAYA
jgi:hypothetical protein